MYIKNSLLRLQPGIHILRHPKGGAPLTVSRSIGNAICTGELEIISTEKTQGSILRDGSDCIVLLVKRAPVEMLISAYLASAEELMPTLRVDMVSLDPEASASVAPSSEAKPATFNISEKGISLIGHIENVGDVAVSDGALLGDPSKQFRLEGFQVMWPDKPAKVDISCQVSVEGVGDLPSVNVGNFCGTRGEARRITDVTFSLVGTDAAKFQLLGTAHFSGGFQVPISSGLTLSGPSGFEHLACLSLQVVVASKKTAGTSAWLDSSKTKTFKASGKSKVVAKT
nr:hypothetical protein [uncultured Undibacterium sp.]